MTVKLRNWMTEPIAERKNVKLQNYAVWRLHHDTENHIVSMTESQLPPPERREMYEQNRTFSIIEHFVAKEQKGERLLIAIGCL